jgi:hypothetical protein
MGNSGETPCGISNAQLEHEGHPAGTSSFRRFYTRRKNRPGAGRLLNPFAAATDRVQLIRIPHLTRYFAA